MNASMLKGEIGALLGMQPLQAIAFWRALAGRQSNQQPEAPTPSDLSVKTPVKISGADSRFNGKYLLTGVTHRIGGDGYADLFDCVRAAATGDRSSQQVWGLWLRVKREVGRQPSHVRHQIAHELAHTLQQGGRR